MLQHGNLPRKEVNQLHRTENSRFNPCVSSLVVQAPALPKEPQQTNWGPPLLTKHCTDNNKAAASV